MPPRWSTWAGIQAAQLDFKKAPKEQPVRLAGPALVVEEPVRVGMAGVEVEGRVARVEGAVPHVRVKAAPVKAPNESRLTSMRVGAWNHFAQRIDDPQFHRVTRRTSPRHLR